MSKKNEELLTDEWVKTEDYDIYCPECLDTIPKIQYLHHVKGTQGPVENYEEVYAYRDQILRSINTDETNQILECTNCEKLGYSEDLWNQRG